jgi:hypothetical protein
MYSSSPLLLSYVLVLLEGVRGQFLVIATRLFELLIDSV